MFRIGPSCRSVASQVLRPDFRFNLREFQQITKKLQHESKVVPMTGILLLRRNKLRQTLWRQYHKVFSILHRSGLINSNSQLIRALASNTSRNFHTSTHNNQDEKGNENKDGKKDKDNDKDKMLFLLKSVTYFTLLLSLAVSLLAPDLGRIGSQVSWVEFVHQMLSKGEVQQIVVLWDVGLANVILHEDAVLNGKPVRHRVFTMQIPDVDKFEEKLREAEQQLGISPANGVPVVFERQKDSVWPSLAASLFLVFLLLNAVAAFKSMKPMNFLNQSITKAKFILVDPRLKQGVGVKFADIAGMKEAKQEVMEFVDYLKKSDHYRRLGAKVPKGSLLLGPPGCGKTLLAKAVATEANVPFLSMNGSEFIEMVGGLGASRVRDLFKAARRMAPCIVYIDEIDAIGSKRSGHDFGNSEKMQTLLQLLIEMDGMASNQGVIMLASTNRAEVLDEALLRPGRFDRHIFIGLPTLIERREIFEVYLNRLKLESSASHFSGRLAQLTPNYSGADIANICNEAALHAAGLNQKKVIAADLEYAVSRVKFGREKQERTICDDERKQIAFYLAGQTIVGWMLRNTDALMKVSIIQYTSGVGSLQHFKPSSFLSYKEELCDRMVMYLGGRAAESMVFHQNSTQAESDLKKVSNVAYNMITSYGMNEVVGEVSFPPLDDNQRRFYSRKLHATIDFEARKLIAECFSTAQNVLKDNADKLEMLAEALLKKETLSYEDICQLVGTPPHGHKNLVDIIEFGPESSPQSNTTTPAESPQ